MNPSDQREPNVREDLTTQTGKTSHSDRGDQPMNSNQDNVGDGKSLKNEVSKLNVDAKLFELGHAVSACNLDLLTTARMPNGDVMLVFETNHSASQFLSAVCFFGPAGRNQQIIDGLVEGEGTWRCTTMPVLAINAPGYYDITPPLPPMLVHVVVRFPSDQIDYALNAWKATCVPYREGDKP